MRILASIAFLTIVLLASSSISPAFGGNLDFDGLCRKGEIADNLIVTGQYPEAILAYENILEEMFDVKKQADSFLVAKSTLGLLFAYIKNDQIKEAAQIWNANEKSRYGMGIKFIESGQTSVHDLMVYFMICSFFHSQTFEESDKQARSVNHYMEKVCRYASSDEPEILNLALSNWQKCLASAYESKDFKMLAKPDLLESLDHYMQTYKQRNGSDPRIVPLDFPTLSAWEPPSE